MSPRTKNTLWFIIPALATAAAIAAISFPGLEETKDEVGSTTLAVPVIAMIIFAGIGGAVVGGIFYGIRRLATRGKPLR